MLFTEMNDVEKREVRMYGCTVLEMKEAIEHRLDTRLRLLLVRYRDLVLEFLDTSLNLRDH